MDHKITSNLLAKSLTIYDKTNRHFSKLTLFQEQLSSLELSQEEVNFVLTAVILY